MSSKFTIVAVAMFLILTMFIYFLINPSYEKSIKAKYYFEMGHYDKALVLAREAFSVDVYNRMASTVMSQSVISLKYVNYNAMAKKYMKEINSIARHEYITDGDKAKIRLMCEIMTGSYVKLAPSVITDKNLVRKSASYFQKFEKLLVKVNRKI
ncbi:hypothetical protein JHD48_04525 [Sulfurimonas sp. SAG-AH-194-I05]|nr:hypothetical protein [Sulfurimonas sp. SAG-AH-194-I05]MDF1874995.1 hypothetical protein [Sulfurimonas sp. SAG-AH-194-I05]